MHNFLRLKSYSTISDSSLIEVFERGYQAKVISDGYFYTEAILDLETIHLLLNHNSIASIDILPNWLSNISSNGLATISISQRLISLLIPLISLRKRFYLHFNISLYVNSVLPVLYDIHKYYLNKEIHDQIIVNSPFSKRLIHNLLDINVSSLLVDPPIPEICLLTNESLGQYEINSKNIQLGIFSRIIPEKLIHTVIESMKLLGSNYFLTIYGFDTPLSSYQNYLFELIDKLDLKAQIICCNRNTCESQRLLALSNIDICINLSSTMEETMGKTILEATYWGKTVIANKWNGFLDILPLNQLVDTYWSSDKWFYVKSTDLNNLIKSISSIDETYNRSLFTIFYETTCPNANLRNNYSFQDSSTNHYDFEQNHQSLNAYKWKCIEESFAPYLQKDSQWHSLYHLHPSALYLKYENIWTVSELIKIYDHWCHHNTNSVFLSTATEILTNLKSKISLIHAL